MENNILFPMVLLGFSLIFCSYILYDVEKEKKKIDKELMEIGIDISKWEK